MKWQKNCVHALIMLPFCCFIYTSGSPLQNRIIIEGFHDAQVGYEVAIKKIDIKILGAIEGAAGNYISLRNDLQFGIVFPHSPDVEFVPALGINVRYSSIFQDGSKSDEAYSIIPSINLSMNKFINRVLIGGCISLELWNIQKIKNNGFESNWYGMRKYDLNPQFILGYCF